MAGERLLGDGQRDADARLAVEVPVGRDGQQGNRGQNQPQARRQSAGQVGRGALEVKPAERKAQHQEPIQRDEADYDGRHLAGQERTQASHFIHGAVPPGGFVPQVRPLVHAVRHADQRQVHPHEEVGHSQVAHKHPEALLALRSLDDDAIEEGGAVAHDGQSGEDR